MRFPARSLLAVVVVGALAASANTALTLTGAAATDGAVIVPGFARIAGATAPAAFTAGAATGRATALIVEHAAAEAEAAMAGAAMAEAARVEAARAEAGRLEAGRAEAARVEAQRQAPPGRVSEADLRRLREELRRACDDGRLRGRICREI